MFRFSIRKTALGVVAVAAIGGIVYCCWPPHRNLDTPILAGPVNQESPSVYKSNAKRFNVEYDIKEVGPEGLAEVQLWGTKDEGKTWEIWGYDRDLISPVQVQVGRDIRYGFCIVLVGKNGLASDPPKSCDDADIWIDVSEAVD